VIGTANEVFGVSCWQAEIVEMTEATIKLGACRVIAK
jgi:hypothetical protein